MAYTTASEVKKRALIKYDSLNYDLGPPGKPFADEAAFDAYLTDTMIPEVEKIINEYCRRPDFAQHLTEVQLFDGDGFRDFIILSRKPAITVSKLEFKKGDGTWDLKPTADYVVRGDLVRYRTILPEGFQNIRVTYDWGYATIPADVSHVASEICAKLLQKMVAFKMGPLIRVGDYRIQLMNPDIFTQDLKDLLFHYLGESAAIG